MWACLVWMSTTWVWAAQPDLPPAPAEKESAAVDVQLRRLPKIEPGSVVDPGPPTGWSHLLIAAYPRVGSGDVKKVNRTVLRFGSLITFTMAANVVSQELPDGSKRYQLQKVGWGLGTRVRGRNTIVSADTHEQLGADLGYIGAEILKRNEQGLQNSFMQVAQSSTMVVCDYSSLVHHGGEHRWMVIRHAVLLNATDGHLTTLAWLLERGTHQEYALAEDRLQILPPAMHEDRVFHVDAEQFFFGIPKSEAFAVAKIPQGTPANPSAELKSLVALRPYTPGAAQLLEMELRAIARQPSQIAGRIRPYSDLFWTWGRFPQTAGTSGGPGYRPEMHTLSRSRIIRVSRAFRCSCGLGSQRTDESIGSQPKAAITLCVMSRVPVVLGDPGYRDGSQWT